MNQKVKINYQSIILDEYKKKETVHFDRIGTYEQHNQKHNNSCLTFNLDQNTMISIVLLKDKVKLIYGLNHLNLEMNKKIKNQYHTTYGNMNLFFHLLKYSYLNQKIKMVYEILEEEKIISKIYLTINFVKI